jgi:hypothetical protein
MFESKESLEKTREELNNLYKKTFENSYNYPKLSLAVSNIVLALDKIDDKLLKLSKNKYLKEESSQSSFNCFRRDYRK